MECSFVGDEPDEAELLSIIKQMNLSWKQN